MISLVLLARDGDQYAGDIAIAILRQKKTAAAVIIVCGPAVL